MIFAGYIQSIVIVSLVGVYTSQSLEPAEYIPDKNAVPLSL